MVQQQLNLIYKSLNYCLLNIVNPYTHPSMFCHEVNLIFNMLLGICQEIMAKMGNFN